MNSVDILLGQPQDLAGMLSLEDPSPDELRDSIEHVFNQSLQRDQFFGSWADAYLHAEDSQYHVKLTSPNHDLSRYMQTVPAMLNAMRYAMTAWQTMHNTNQKLQFYLPLGLSLSEYRSVQMLHFPPSEALQFLDYLYNPTCRRWELLLLHNDFDGRDNTLMERLIDLVPLAAPGADSKDIDAFNDSFHDYVISLLEIFLGSNAQRDLTAPMVVGGAPAIHCIATTYASQIGKGTTLEPMSLVSLDIVEGKTTNLLCTNHPSTYLFYAFGDHPNEKKALEIMRQDLICAGWQARMAGDWTLEPKKVLDEVTERWKSDSKVRRIMQQSAPEWTFSH